MGDKSLIFKKELYYEKENVIIELIGVSKQFNGNTVVDDFNLYVRKGIYYFLRPIGLW